MFKKKSRELKLKIFVLFVGLFFLIFKSQYLLGLFTIILVFVICVDVINILLRGDNDVD